MSLAALAPSDLIFAATCLSAALACLFFGWRLSVRDRRERAEAAERARALETAGSEIAELRERLAALTEVEAEQAAQAERLAGFETALAAIQADDSLETRLNARIETEAAAAGETVAEMVIGRARADAAEALADLAGQLRAEGASAEAGLRGSLMADLEARLAEAAPPDPEELAARAAAQIREEMDGLRAALPDLVSAACDDLLPERIGAALPARLDPALETALSRLEARLGAALPQRIEQALESAAAPALEAFRARLAASARTPRSLQPPDPEDAIGTGGAEELTGAPPARAGAAG